MVSSLVVYGLVFASVVMLVLPPCFADIDKDVNMIEPVEYVYKKVGDIELILKVYSPAELKEGDPRPAIVFFFGGGFVGGFIGQFQPQSQYLASRGMVAICADYRVKNRHDSTPLDSCADGRSAIRWVRANAKMLGIDANRIVASGGSAGGTVAVMTGMADEVAEIDGQMVSSRPNAMVLFNPATVFAKIDGDELRPEKRLKVYVQRWQRKAMMKISAWHHVSGDEPPTMIHHGDEDDIVPLATAELFTEKMQAKGVRCELMVYEGQGHGFFNHGRDDSKWFKKTMYATDQFLESLGFLEGGPEVENDGK